MSKRSLPTTPTQSNTMWKYLKPLKKKCKLGDTEDSSESQSLEIQSATVSPSSSTVEVRKNGGALAQATPGPSAIIISRASSTSNLGTPRVKKALNKNRKESTSDGESSKENEKSEDTTLSESEEEVIKKPKKKKRNRIIITDDSSDSDNATPNKQTKKIKLEKTSESNNSPHKPKGKETKSATELLKNFQKGTPVKETSKSMPKINPKKDSVKDIHSSWVHNDLPFLRPDKIKDNKGRHSSDPNYDSTTLFVPESFLNNQTPAMRQWWELKSKYMDSVLFFKVGKFYELYHMDAVIGVQHLGFSYMKGDFAHSGFPESAYAKMASALIEKGFKVARVEQTETPGMMGERCKGRKNVSKFDKVVKREICQVTTKATCVYTAQMPEARNDKPYFMYAICMKSYAADKVRFGVCAVETSICQFYLSEFVDDKHFSRLLVLFSEYPPAQILYERGGVNKKFSDMLTTYFRDIRKDSLLSKSQFLTASDTLEKLAAACYFRDKDGNFAWPPIFHNIADDCLPSAECELSVRSLGATMWYLVNAKTDIQVFSAGKFNWYDPLDLIKEHRTTANDYLILDATTINNLDLLGGKGSLQFILDRCETAFGKRMLQRWICRPLCNIEKIKERQNAVNELLNNPMLLTNAKNLLAKMPDLERLLTKINIYGNKFLAKDHPDSRAIFYEAVSYSKIKIKDFIKTLRSFERAQEIPKLFADCESRLLRKTTQFWPRGSYIDLWETLQFFKNAFDQQEAEKEGKITPQKGVEEDFDKVEAEIKRINENLEEYLEKQCKFFGCKVNYFGNDKKRFQIEVPEAKVDRVTTEYMLEGTKKGSKPTRRYSTPKTKEMLADMLKAEEERAKIIWDLNRRIFERLSERQKEFDQVIQCLTILDVLCSLAEYARTFSQDICIPDLKPLSEDPKIILKGGRHPCVPNLESFVPNDTQMGVDGHPNILILTGPNMGGKSTLMRQVAVIAVMAQIGSFVPAASCELTLIDRIFTRLGAQDDIVHGQSTFFVELAEASSMLQHAFKHSLLLIDELGRGTSTHDGNAIATAYVDKLTTIGCRTIFSTHYHSLVDHYVGRNDVQLGHMACMVENDEDPTQESVTFLYKLAEGRCPKSYGFNVARLAGLDRQIILRGREIAKGLEEECRLRDVFHSIFTSKNMSSIRQLLLTVA